MTTIMCRELVHELEQKRQRVGLREGIIERGRNRDNMICSGVRATASSKAWFIPSRRGKREHATNQSVLRVNNGPCRKSIGDHLK